MQDAQRLINVIRKAIEQEVGTTARANYRYGVVSSGGAYEVSAYLDGDTDAVTAYIRQASGGYVADGTPIVVITTKEGDAWIDQVIPNLYAKIAIDFNNGIIYLGDGTAPPTDPGVAGQALVSGGPSGRVTWGGTP